MQNYVIRPTYAIANAQKVTMFFGIIPLRTLYYCNDILTGAGQISCFTGCSGKSQGKFGQSFYTLHRHQSGHTLPYLFHCIFF